MSRPHYESLVEEYKKAGPSEIKSIFNRTCYYADHGIITPDQYIELLNLDTEARERAKEAMVEAGSERTENGYGWVFGMVIALVLLLWFFMAG